jgi:hypothetical protein
VEEKGFKFQADMDGFLIDWKDKGYTLELIGEDEVEGTKVYHLKLDTNDDLVMDMYMDAEYFLTIKIHSKLTMDENEIETETYLSDYKEVEGIVTPFAVETRMDEQTMNQIMIEAVEFGVEVDSAIFEMPAKKETKPAE